MLLFTVCATAGKARINIICKYARIKGSRVTEYSVGLACIKLLGNHEFNTSYGNVSAGLKALCRYHKRLHTALIFVALGIGFRQHYRKGYALVGANVLQGHVKLHDTSEGTQYNVARIYFHRFVAAGYCYGNGLGTRLGYYRSAIQGDNGRGEGNDISLVIRINNAFVNFNLSGAGARMLHCKGQRCAFACGNAELVYSPFHRSVSDKGCNALGRRRK